MKDPVEHAALYQELINVTKEIKDLEPVLLRPDAQVLSAKPSQDIVTREKTGADGVRYVIAYNRWQRGHAGPVCPAIPRAIGDGPPRNGKN